LVNEIQKNIYFTNIYIFLGMFPYTMLATIPIFFHNNWPRKFLNHYTPKWLYKEESLQYSSSCLYSKEEIKPEESQNQSKISNTNSIKNAPVKSTFRHKFFTIFALLYIAEQGFLPYSHFITKGYNNWTNVSLINQSNLRRKIFCRVYMVIHGI